MSELIQSEHNFSFVVQLIESRSLLPTLITQYQAQLPDKKFQQAKLHGFYALNLAEGEDK